MTLGTFAIICAAAFCLGTLFHLGEKAGAALVRWGIDRWRDRRVDAALRRCRRADEARHSGLPGKKTTRVVRTAGGFKRVPL